jgi:uncharacterized OB-fold protein
VTTEYRKPVPSPSPEAKPYWDGAREHKLLMPYCPSCARHFWFPRPFCPRCFSWEIEWREVSGKGTLYSFAIQWRPQMPGFESELPYVTAIVELAEGPRLVTNVVDIAADPEQVTCGMSLEVAFRDIDEQVSLPVFRPASAAK